ncbi:hypothetical protein BOH78_4756 [Pichia kudriavzevii]|uniref:Uncharacterized protein n=1 Tax=Pichia kudriavzevii TaxID=4909 RepID=A0A099P758_PICKU|nr:hypothetical protein JL09_g279 [Pichia kudriavzevii]ONH71079.1 hypothetical protein BOH78_4756 [Pichia kudriavzevii]
MFAILKSSFAAVKAASTPSVRLSAPGIPALSGIFMQQRFGSRGGNRGNTYQPNTLKRKRRLGFLARMKSRTGRQIVKRRFEKGPVKDDTTNPTLFKVMESQTFLQDETVLSYVDEFINKHPLNSLQSGSSEIATGSSTYSGINPTVLSQLNRLQRSLRGLPPLFDDETVPPSQQTATDSQPTENKKIVFDE